MTTVITELLVLDPPLAHELQQQWKAHEAVNAVHTFRLDRITLQAGFSGSREIGQWVGAITAALEPTSTISHSMAGGDGACATSELADEGVMEHEEQLQVTQDIADFFASIVD
ncbi:hypothetical protein BDR07DRAFT_1481848 [Suillus spraguei]|nr:hypothetical protein BDR07DRAFT_1481848 [Suillus spraguei]